MDILLDKYILGESNSKIINSFDNQRNIDLILKRNNRFPFGPRYVSFTVASEGIQPPIKVSPLDGILGDGATEYENTRYVKGLGKVTVTIYVEIAGKYNLDIDYLAGDGVAEILINVNNSSNSIECICYGTYNWNLSSANVVKTEVNLVSGKNIIELSAKQGQSAPWIGNMEFLIEESPFSTEFDANIGEIKSPAFKLPDGFVGGIGFDGGELIENVNVPQTGVYSCNIVYLAGGEERTMDMDINGKWTGITYNFPKPSEWWEAQVATFDVNLQKGVNNIRFYSRNRNLAPWIGPLSFTRKYFSNTVLAVDTIIEGTAVIIQNSVANSGYGLGSLKFNINIPDTNQYSFIIEYYSRGRPSTAILYTNGEYTKELSFEATSDDYEFKFKILSLNLKKGINEMLIY
ncbi:hypothetical protein [Clostridium massiliodielmoense]|uniref:hypothetical protein n=1 Tax=Clostridium massiliodielmoense TaxID=1776385 RepID=UPI000A26DA95|nr:hypothetical protein [Clostridium massiliodielmoense]